MREIGRQEIHEPEHALVRLRRNSGGAALEPSDRSHDRRARHRVEEPGEERGFAQLARRMIREGFASERRPQGLFPESVQERGALASVKHLHLRGELQRDLADLAQPEPQDRHGEARDPARAGEHRGVRHLEDLAGQRWVHANRAHDLRSRHARIVHELEDRGGDVRQARDVEGGRANVVFDERDDAARDGIIVRDRLGDDLSESVGGRLVRCRQGIRSFRVGAERGGRRRVVIRHCSSTS